ncbi:nitrous oxide reductase accessory protein NosL [Halorubrum ezzemoulense]|uniref:Nitrous oxide reductase accessory protein NosL n=1 Tax=Halorubrum ezzemoulense TaxID=337243 RepID=A0A256K7W0_HALEZ|nr:MULTISPECIES: nitrous oxide reductase accessory protein NosL [Halorubrum]OYR57524.1 nitrous oxide reductase accessory protein NosL [Halorubrum ezzemoulense]OYR77100.1 nitrous oxide reductase accessory protein NosL [Halorubrum ezzemoulense]OYR80955.1 nitrous oxide reductase accessory protein NosL [Halorubrum ezzemoulense]PHQ42211.1 nitrous oxide reductase accessory protein NosL [Halorubrum sp. C191]QAY20159.1 nitrous oxide reductase accessory protein NosL [Halorubrum ezzemoulense]
MTSNNQPTSAPDRRENIPRRRLLAGLAAGGAAAVAGCAGGGSESVSPVSIDDDQACDQCGMIVADHPGTVGQVHFEDDEPEGGRPAQFCSGTCTYTYRFDAADAGRTPVATFLTDYSAVDQEVFEEGGDTMFSSHVESEAFARETTLTVVARSEVIGAMGPDLVPFTDEDDVEDFVAEYGGEAMPATEVDRATLEAL